MSPSESSTASNGLFDEARDSVSKSAALISLQVWEE